MGRILLSLVLLFSTVGVALVPQPAFAVSEAQWAYEACAKAYNGEYRGKPNYKAIVAGVSDSATSCFWSSGYKSVGEALRRATANCERKYPRCYTFATSSGLSSWSSRISSMGGDDGSRRNQNAANAAAAASIIGGVIGIISGSGGGASGTWSGGGNQNGHNNLGPSVNCPGATIAVDENCRPLH